MMKAPSRVGVITRPEKRFLGLLAVPQSKDLRQGASRMSDTVSSDAMYMRRKREEWAIKGLCHKCGAEAVFGKARCQKCIDDDKARKQRQSAAEVVRLRKLRQQRLAQGLCARCGKLPHLDGRQLCDSCRLYHKQKAEVDWRTIPGRIKRSERQRAWVAANPERVRARAVRYNRNARQKVFDHYGWACVCCGESHPEFLTIDHINNDGNAHRARVGSANIYKSIVREQFPDDLQTLCWNCNEGKRIYGECPHQRERNQPDESGTCQSEAGL